MRENESTRNEVQPECRALRENRAIPSNPLQLARREMKSEICSMRSRESQYSTAQDLRSPAGHDEPDPQYVRQWASRLRRTIRTDCRPFRVGYPKIPAHFLKRERLKTRPVDRDNKA